jgi:hypothetical protein
VSVQTGTQSDAIACTKPSANLLADTIGKPKAYAKFYSDP